MPTATVNGTRLNYLQVGGEGGDDGREDLVLVHGLATSLAFWYLQYAAVLSARFRVTLFDLRGHGRSARPAAGYTPGDLTGDLRGLLDHLGIARTHLMAHSFGGIAALGLACDQPARVQSLVLADTHIAAARRGPRVWEHGRKIQALLDECGMALDTSDPYFGYHLLTETARFHVRGEKPPAPLQHLISPIVGTTDTRTAVQWLELMDTTSARTDMLGDDGLSLEALRRLGMPIMAMYGELSQARLSGEELLGVWPHAVFRSLRDAGHFFPTTRAREVIATCERFWSGDLRPFDARRDEAEATPFFRSDRCFERDGAWYVARRGVPPLGPFASGDDAIRSSGEFMTTVTAGLEDEAPRSMV